MIGTLKKQYENNYKRKDIETQKFNNSKYHLPSNRLKPDFILRSKRI